MDKKPEPKGIKHAVLAIAVVGLVAGALAFVKGGEKVRDAVRDAEHARNVSSDEEVMHWANSMARRLDKTPDGLGGEQSARSEGKTLLIRFTLPKGTFITDADADKIRSKFLTRLKQDWCEAGVQHKRLVRGGFVVSMNVVGANRSVEVMVDRKVCGLD